MFSNVALVLFTVFLMQVVVSCAWALGQWALELPRRPALHWAAASALGAAGMALTLLRGTLPLWFAIPLGNVFTLASALAFARGLRVFLGLPLNDRENLALLAGVSVTAVAAGFTLQGPGVVLLAMATSAGVLWAFTQAAWQSARALRLEFNNRVALALMLPMALMSCMVLVRLAGALSGGVKVLHVDTLLNVAVALLYLLFTALLHLSMASMVVLRLMASMRRLSTRDALTGLLNRGEWLRQLQAQHRWLGRFGEPFSVLLLDIDHFKRINDTWGHPAGDAVLVSTAQLLLSTVRGMDVVGRLGGEEFVVLLPRADAAEALAAAERLRSALAATALAWKQQAIELTVSVGVATATDADETPERLIERADAAMYVAKRSGRNRSVVAPGLAVVAPPQAVSAAA
ncbi:diguanylate cyclase (GGDEF) domain-containing protein [Burkholderiales bacterium JOSHI_001]|nr:diguanylate cyclase (GGDEF) domain-containing protein [Burkholderiales bacterium JOSHI_001]